MPVPPTLARRAWTWMAPVISLVVLLPGSVAARQASPSPCAGEDFHAFDYWIGHWVVRNASGVEVGRSHVSSISDGCAVLEEWTSAAGTTGTSINYFTAADRLWRQDWVGGGGQILHLSGGLEEGAMTLQGPRNTPQGTVIDRIRWTPMEGGKVEQRWDVSKDQGQTWSTAFRGVYEPETGG